MNKEQTTLEATEELIADLESKQIVVRSKVKTLTSEILGISQDKLIKSNENQKKEYFNKIMEHKKGSQMLFQMSYDNFLEEAIDTWKIHCLCLKSEAGKK